MTKATHTGLYKYDTEGDQGSSQHVVHDATTVFRFMAEEVERTNREKGWYETNPAVQEYADWQIRELGKLESGQFLKLERLFGDRTFGEDVALLHSEVSEMLEAFRDGGIEDQTAPDLRQPGDPEGEGPPKPEGVGSEAADVLIRLLDTCQRHGLDLFAEWRRKMDYNKTRPARHGNKRL